MQSVEYNRYELLRLRSSFYLNSDLHRKLVDFHLFRRRRGIGAGCRHRRHSARNQITTPLNAEQSVANACKPVFTAVSPVFTLTVYIRRHMPDFTLLGRLLSSDA